MSIAVHNCDLQLQDCSGFSQLPPNASRLKKLTRSIRKLLSINPNNFKCKEYFRNKSSQAAEQRRYVQSHHYFVIHPFSRINSLVEFLFFLTWMYSIVMYPLVIFSVRVFALLRKSIVVVQRFLVITQFFTGYTDRVTREVVIEPKSIIWHYITGYFFVDFIATGVLFTILEYLLHVHFVIGNLEVGRNIIMNIIRMICYSFRLDAILNYLQDVMHILNCPKTLQSISAHVLRTFVLIHILACFLYGFPKVVNHGKWSEASWIYQANIHENETSFFSKYRECLLIAVCYFFGASHGMYEVTEPIEQLSLSVITLFGRLYTLFMLADLLKIFGIVGVSQSKYESQLTQLDEYIVSKKLPDELRNRLIKFYEYKLQKNFFNEPAILSTISDNLRTELFLFAARKVIQKVYMLKIIPKENLGTIIASFKLQVYSPNEVIMESGCPTQHVYFISSGTAAIYNVHGKELHHLEDGDEFGIINSLPNTKGQYLVKAVEATEVFYIDKVHFFHLLEELPDAKKFYEEAVKQRIKILTSTENIIRKGGVDFLSELRNGQILENLKVRPTIDT